MTDTPITANLRARPPGLHGAGDEYWGLAWPALEWLERNVEEGMQTLESGAGSSTIVFAARGADHVAVTPDPSEEARIRGRCDELGISSERVTFRIGPSHEVIPALEPRQLDVVLVDGAHGFPYPVLDWWFLAPQLKIGGRMLIDDAYMPPVGALVDALRAQPSWEVAETVGYRTVVVRKVAEGLPDFDWGGERLGGRMNFRYLAPAPRALAAARHRAFSSPFGLRVVELARRRSGLRWRKTR
ncbi:MAG: class I SAM-dependent methyltransferase [Thermoleophilia bacterium]